MNDSETARHRSHTTGGMILRTRASALRNGPPDIPDANRALLLSKPSLTRLTQSFREGHHLKPVKMKGIQVAEYVKVSDTPPVP